MCVRVRSQVQEALGGTAWHVPEAQAGLSGALRLQEQEVFPEPRVCRPEASRSGQRAEAGPCTEGAAEGGARLEHLVPGGRGRGELGMGRVRGGSVRQWVWDQGWNSLGCAGCDLVGRGAVTPVAELGRGK